MTTLFRSAFVVLALVLSSLAAPAARGQAAGAFTRMGFDARGLALGGALAGDGFGQASPFYNPALAPFTAQQHLEASVALLSLDRELQTLQFAAPLRPRAGVAFGLVHAGVSGIDGRDGNGAHTEELTTDEFAFFLAFGVRMGERASLGVGLQLFRSDLYDDVQAVNTVGVDVGLTYRATDALRLGLVVEDLLATYNYDTSSAFGDAGKTTDDVFPTRVRLGAGYLLMDGRLRLVGEVENRFTTEETRTRRFELIGEVPVEVTDVEELRLHEARFRAGAEYALAGPLVVRAGLDRLGADDANGLRPTLGFMVEQPVGNLRVQAAYAYARERLDIANMHLLTLRVFL